MTSEDRGSEFVLRDMFLKLDLFDLPSRILKQEKYSKFRRDLLADLNFITFHWNPSEVPEPNVVFLGNTSTNHFYVLAEMFPNFNFYTYNGKMMDHPRIHCYHENIRNSDLDRWVNRNDILLICNQKTKKQSKLSDDKPSSDDLKMMTSWWRKIAPKACSILFTCPLTHATGRHFTVPHGSLMFEAHGSRNSRRTRLLIGKITNRAGTQGGRTNSHPDLNIDSALYMSSIHHHNFYTRVNNSYDKFQLDRSPGSYNYDMSYEFFSYIQYFKKTSHTVTAHILVKFKNHIDDEQSRLDNKRTDHKSEEECAIDEERKYIEGFCLKIAEPKNITLGVHENIVTERKITPSHANNDFDNKYGNASNDALTGEIIVLN